MWGKCQGSGKHPYQVSIDLTGPAFRCSCPSRKFPCKHGLALLLLWVDGSGSVADVEEAADFASAWAAERTARGEARAAAMSARDGRAPDPVARARRLEERLALMTGGMDDFARWLTDLVRGGTASARHQPYTWWDGTAARLVDSQLPGLADDVRTVGADVSWRPDWSDRLLLALGRWWTATRAWATRDTLTDAELGDLRAYLGWSFATDAVRSQDAVHDRWTVLGAHRTDDGRLQQQRTWLCGESTGETVQVLDFAASGQVLPVARVVGSVLDATLARYPGAAVRRALFVDEPAVVDARGELPAGSTLAAAQAVAAAALARNPWSRRVPVVVSAASVSAAGGTAAGGTTATGPAAPGTTATGPATAAAGSPSGRVAPDGASAARLVDTDGTRVELTADTDTWMLLALTGGHPTDVFGELDGGRLRVLTAVVDGEAVAL